MSEITPVTHTEKVVAGEVQPVTHLEKVIAEYSGGNVYENLEAGTNILIEETADGKAKISASGEVSSEDTVARADIAAIKDGTNIDSFGDVETALATKANTATTYTKTEADTALSGKVDKETGKGLSTNDYTTAEKTKLAGIAEGAEVNVQSNWTQTTTTADDYIKNKPTLGTAAAKNATDTYNATGTDVTTGKAVAAALATLPEPMVFKGSLGTGGTITTLPTASNSNKGYVYKVITAGTYASQSAKVGDTFISDGSAWVLIPSGDEPSGTVTNVAVANGGGLTISGSPITSSGTINVGHSNSVTAKTSSSVKKIAYDAYGHITGSSELSTAESNALASGITSANVAQITTNKNNILLLEQLNGRKNVLQYDALETTNANGVTYTINDDYSITVTDNPSRSGTSYVILKLGSGYAFVDDYCNGNYKLYGCPSGGSEGTYWIYVSAGDYYKADTGSGIILTPTSQIGIRIILRLSGEYISSPITFKPMICRKELDSTYDAYAMTTGELTTAIRGLLANS